MISEKLDLKDLLDKMRQLIIKDVLASRMRNMYLQTWEADTLADTLADELIYNNL